jgi:hypothetical protein
LCSAPGALQKKSKKVCLGALISLASAPRALMFQRSSNGHSWSALAGEDEENAMSGYDGLYRDAMARPGDTHGHRGGTIVIAVLILGALIAAVIAVPMLTA